jgi:hypothetical protein
VWQAYISQLASITPEAFANIGVRLVVIGCGEPDVIPFYKGAKKRSPIAAFRVQPRGLNLVDLVTP